LLVGERRENPKGPAPPAAEEKKKSLLVSQEVGNDAFGETFIYLFFFV
jgi:hypothetical protein